MSRTRLAKLSPPRPGHWVMREHLHERLDELVRSAAGWIAAGPGAGKSTLAATWAMARDRRLLWYRVDVGDTDPGAAFGYFAELARSARPKLRLPGFRTEDGARLEAFARSFFRAFYAALPASATLVVDDAHEAGPPFDEVLAALIREAPGDVAVLILSRRAPSGVLLDEVARGELRAIEPGALAFTDDEAAQLLAGRVGAARARALCRQADGWAAGILLMSQADPARAPGAAPRSEALDSFFAERVMAQLAPTQRRVLAAASLLPDVEPSLLHRMGFGAEASAILEDLCSRHMFVTRLERATTTWRLHDLLREAFQSRFDSMGDAVWRDAMRRVASEVAAERGLVREAVRLHLELGEPERALALAEARGRELVRGHRLGEVEAIASMLRERATRSVALQFALGEVGWHRNDARAAVARLETAFALCTEPPPSPTALLIGVTALTAILEGWQDFTGAKDWAERVAAHLAARERLADAVDRLRVDSTCLLALDTLWDLPLGERRELVDRILEQIRSDPSLPPDEALAAASVLMECASYTLSDESLFGEIARASGPWLKRPDLSPAVEAGWLNTYAPLARRWPAQAAGAVKGSPVECLERALALAVEHGARSAAYTSALFLANIATSENDLPTLRERLKALRELTDESQSTQLQNLLSAEAAMQALSGDWTAARRTTLRQMEIHERADAPPSERWTTEMGLARIDIASGDAAWAHEFLLALAERSPPGMRREFARILAEVATAAAQWESSRRIDPDLVRTIVEGASEHAWPGFSILLAPISARLCAEALRLGIEPEFARHVIRERRLPAPAPYEPHWPWPIRVYALGDLRIEVDGEPLRAGPRAQRKLIDLVKTLVAYGPALTDTGVVLDALWPDAEGGAARAAFDMAVMRLRKLLGRDDALRLETGRIGFDTGLVWVDAFAYAAGALDAYPGPLFGADPVEPWWAAARERLHQGFLRRTQERGRALERAGDLDAAIEAYEAGLTQDPLAEELYQGVIRCRVAQGRAADAMRAFRRCREQLSIVLGVAPSAATQALVAPLSRP